jgi:hypothetical protein
MVATRITPALRERLDHAAQAHSRSLSQEIQVRLTNSFEARQYRKMGEPDVVYGRLPEADVRNAALGALIGEVAGRIEDTTGEPWTKNEYAWTVLKEAVRILLSQLPLPIEPNSGGPPKPPQKLQADIQTYRSLELENPQRTAEMIALIYLWGINESRSVPFEQEHMRLIHSDEWYRYSYYEKAFGLKKRKTEITGSE